MVRDYLATRLILLSTQAKRLDVAFVVIGLAVSAARGSFRWH